VRAFSLALKFLVELAAFAALAYWGASVGSGIVSVLLAVAAPAVAIVLWGLFAAPRSSRRLRTNARIPFELAVFAVAAIALRAAGATTAAICFAAVAAISAALLARFDLWEE
jgi:hypothetical protein